ncbi:MAG: alpha/beta hydrolase [Deltaproteobacteria bacterium]|nr:alpha/beta hydrolase [Deltaproteobacteria bacterium]
MTVSRTIYTVESDYKTELYVETWGEGRPLVLLDGIMCNGHVWKYFTPYFSDYKIIHLHYPGHGNSAVPYLFSDLSAKRLSKDIVNILNFLEVESASFIAHSFGVQVALETALDYPGYVDSMVLICGAPGGFISSFSNSRVLQNILTMMEVSLKFVPSHVSKIWSTMDTDALVTLAKKSNFVNSRLVTIEDLKPYFEGFFKTHPATVVKMVRASEKLNLFERLEEIKNIKSLIIAGANDRFIPYEISKKMYHKLAESEFFLARAGTHSLPLEQPDLINLKIEEFLASVK